MSIAAALAAIQARAAGFRPRAGLILGSGLGPLADAVQDPVAIPYGEIPGFPDSSVAGHAGRLVLGALGGLPVACFAGRRHIYEGGGFGGMAVAIRTLKAMGAEILMATNAAGSLRPEIGPGRLMLITDHINMMGGNPLIGPNDETVGPRFPPMGGAYDPELCGRLRNGAAALGIALSEGVYLAVTGPAFETPAEIRAFRMLGADAVGMSTVPEVLLARHCGLRVAAISAITNLAEGLSDVALDHEHTLHHAGQAAASMQALTVRFLEGLAR